MINAKIGSTLSVEVVSVPKSAAGKKTLLRLFRRDPAIERQARLQQRKRPSFQEWRRGGMWWHHQMKSESPIQIQPGAKYSLRATVDVLRDLNSVERYIKVG